MIDRMTAEEWDRDWEDWKALRDACRATHKSGGLQTQAICCCGAECGGSAACSMLRQIIDFIRFADVAKFRSADRNWIKHMRDFV